jgi:hypothetical protein
MGQLMQSFWIRLVIGGGLGLAIGLVYGWLIQPVEYVDTAPNSLRIDYRTDYVLMVAQSYAGDDDLSLAERRLAALGPQPVIQQVEQAIAYALENNFSPIDIDVLNQLAARLRMTSPEAEIGG